MRVAEQARRFDGTVEQLGGLGQVAAHPAEASERLDEDEEQLTLAGRPRNFQRARGMPVAVGVAVEVQLAPGDPGRRFEVARKLLVRQRIDDRRSLREGGVRPLGTADHGLCEREDRERCCGQTRVADLPRGGYGAFGPFVHVLVFRAPDEVHGELGHQGHRLRRALVGKHLDRPHEARARLFLSPEQAFDCCAGAGEPRVPRREGDGLQQRVMAVGEVPGRGQRARAGEQKLDALLCRRVLGQQPQRVAEPARSALRCEPRGAGARLPQERDSVGVPFACGALDVVRSSRCACSARRERVAAPLVRVESPTRGRRLVDRAADERMPEAEAPRHVGGSNEVELQ